MITLQFQVGHPRSPVTVVIQEHTVEDAIEALREFDEEYNKDETPIVGPVYGGWKPPTIN